MIIKWVVTVLGVGLIVWVNWYFLFSKNKARPEKKS
jgi:plastocyanin domain-containing protein